MASFIRHLSTEIDTCQTAGLAVVFPHLNLKKETHFESFFVGVAEENQHWSLRVVARHVILPKSETKQKLLLSTVLLFPVIDVQRDSNG